MRYLQDTEILAVLSRGQSVEQFLGHNLSEGTVCWLELRSNDSLIDVWVFEVENVGSAEYLDIYSFPEIGTSFEQPIATLPFEQALQLCFKEHGAIQDRWVKQGVVQSEYHDSLSNQTLES